jgi:hypothetical protein
MGSPRLRRTPDVVLRTVADETFLLPVRGDLMSTVEMFVLSEVGRFIWSRTDGARGYEELVADVRGEFEVSEEQARSDVREFLNQLQAYGLLSEEAD